jgi:GT2 family glycosyltransferase
MNNQGSIVITPVKDSLETTRETINQIKLAEGSFEYFIFNDFSSKLTEEYLQEHQEEYGYKLINLSNHVKTPSPNYKTVLQMARKKALESQVHLIIVESDVMVKANTIAELIRLANSLENPGMIGAVTVDTEGNINFPYNHVNENDPDLFITERSLSFCCTLLTNTFLESVDFIELNNEKDWYDVFISKKSRRSGFNNYMVKSLPVIHKPHSSRPWKMEKYSNPIKYYFKKIFSGRDRI